MLVLIGSRAANLHIPGFRASPIDMDIVGTYDDITSFVKSLKTLGHVIKAQYPIDEGKKIVVKTDEIIVEAEVAWEGSSAEQLLTLVYSDLETRSSAAGSLMLIPSLNLLYMLKMSHRYKKDSPHFLKTMRDIQAMRKAGAVLQESHMEFFKAREKATYTNVLPKLNKAKGEFFSGDGIVYEWDHDSLHEALKFFSKPAYTFFSGGEVWSDMDKFETLSEEIKLHAVLEESLVLASERSQLCFDNVDPTWSFEFALSKVCTSITSGRFRKYAWENYDKVINLYKEKGVGYMERVHRGIQQGAVCKLPQ